MMINAHAEAFISPRWRNRHLRNHAHLGLHQSRARPRCRWLLTGMDAFVSARPPLVLLVLLSTFFYYEGDTEPPVLATAYFLPCLYLYRNFLLKNLSL